MSILHRFEILALIFQNFKRSRDLKCTPMLQNFNMCNARYSLRSICKPNLKCLASSTPKIWPGPRNVEMSHVTMTTIFCCVNCKVHCFEVDYIEISLSVWTFSYQSSSVSVNLKHSSSRDAASLSHRASTSLYLYE